MRSLVIRWLQFPIKFMTEFRLPDHEFNISSVSLGFEKHITPGHLSKSINEHLTYCTADEVD